MAIIDRRSVVHSFFAQGDTVYRATNDSDYDYPPKTVRPRLPFVQAVAAAIAGANARAPRTERRRPSIYSGGRLRGTYYGGGGSKKYDGPRDVRHLASRPPITHERLSAWREHAAERRAATEAVELVKSFNKERRPAVRDRITARLASISREHGRKMEGFIVSLLGGKK